MIKVNLCSAEAQKGSSVLTKAEDNYHRFYSEVYFFTLPITTNSKYVKHIVLLYLFCDVFLQCQLQKAELCYKKLIAE